jgi:hypothetical protein
MWVVKYYKYNEYEWEKCWIYKSDDSYT